MASSSKNTMVFDTETLIAVEILTLESISKTDLLKALEPLKSASLPKMVELIFSLPLKEPGTSTTLKELRKLSRKVDKEDFQAAVDMESFYWTTCRILDKGQGLSLHTVAKLELLNYMLGHLLTYSDMDEFRSAIAKWLSVIKDNQTKE